MARRPKGAVIQPLPSWNLRNMAGAASSTGNLALGALGAVGLINNATAGEWLVIWDVRVIALPNPIGTILMVADMAICTGRLASSLLIANNNSPLISFGGTIPGTNWTNNTSATEIGNIFNSVDLIYSSPTAYYTWGHDWPICGIAPGDSMVVYSDGSAYHDFGVSFIYEVVPGGI